MINLIVWYLVRVLLVIILLALWFMWAFGLIPSWRRYKLIQKLPGPKGTFYFGNLLELMAVESNNILDYLIFKFEGFDRLMAMWTLGMSNVFLKDPIDVQVILSSQEHIAKGWEYKLIHPWLDQGLLTSTGEKWHTRRKLLTPAFHFKILEDNMTTLNKDSKTLCKKLLASTGQEVVLEDYITLCTLDVITKTAMGIDLDAQAGGKEYVSKLKKLSSVFSHRMISPHLFNDYMFFFSPSGWEFRKAVKYLHGFSEKVIGERKRIFASEKREIEAGPLSSSSGKVRRAFLDLMLEYESKNPGTFQDKDIREEVDTFMFEGHDTTSAALVFIFFNLARYQDIQEKVFQELREIFGGDDRDTTVNDLHKMVYLEKVIKESLRLYPSVPALSRFLQKDLKLNDGLIIPANANVIIPFILIHKNPKYWPNPEMFDPERFSEENITGRHPFAYIPFSAGPRNCIGQKFAMMELKTVVSTVLRKLKVVPVTKEEDLKLGAFLVLRALQPVKCKFLPRGTNDL